MARLVPEPGREIKAQRRRFPGHATQARVAGEGVGESKCG